MKIDFERTGGFLGLRVAASIDTSEIPETEAVTLHELITEANFFELPERLESPNPAMDQFEYVITMSAESHEPHTVAFSDMAAPLEMLPLIRKLTRLARGQYEKPAEPLDNIET